MTNKLRKTLNGLISKKGGKQRLKSMSFIKKITMSIHIRSTDKILCCILQWSHTTSMMTWKRGRCILKILKK